MKSSRLGDNHCQKDLLTIQPDQSDFPRQGAMLIQLGFKAAHDKCLVAGKGNGQRGLRLAKQLMKSETVVPPETFLQHHESICCTQQAGSVSSRQSAGLRLNDERW